MEPAKWQIERGGGKSSTRDSSSRPSRSQQVLKIFCASTRRALAYASAKEMAGSMAVNESAIVGNRPFRKSFFTILFHWASVKAGSK